MEIKKLTSFLTVLQSGSFSKAAEKLNYTQSGITHMMNSIEKEIGFKLLVRDYRGISLTKEGKDILPCIEELVNSNIEFEQQIEKINGNKKLTLFIGAYSSIALIWLPEITKRFQQVHPDVNLEFSHYTVAGMKKAVKNGEIDIGFGSRQNDNDIMWIDLHDDPLLAILPLNYKLESAKFDIKNFESQEFLMPSYGFDKDIMRVLNKNNVTPAIKSTSVDDSVIVSMVGCGLGISILSELVMKTGNFSSIIKAVPLNPDAYRTLGIAIRHENAEKKYIKDFIAISEEFIKDYYAK